MDNSISKIKRADLAGQQAYRIEPDGTKLPLERVGGRWVDTHPAYQGPPMIRIAWLSEGHAGHGLWFPDSESRRKLLEAYVTDGCERYGAGSHWIEPVTRYPDGRVVEHHPEGAEPHPDFTKF